MNNINKHLNNLWKVFSGGATVLAYQAYKERVEARTWLAEQKELIIKHNTDMESVKLKLEGVIDENVRNNLLSQQLELQESLEKITRLIERFTNRLEVLEKESVISNVVKEEFSYYEKEIGNLVSKSLTRSLEIKNYIESKDIKSNFLENNPLWDWIQEFNNYLSTLSLYELCFLINTLLSVFILTCLISILFSFYGDFLITKFKLEEKFPKLSGLIKLRVKLLHSSVLINSLLIIIALLFLFYINIHTLFLF